MRQHSDGAITFAHWLKQRRRALDLTQEQLAERVGYASPTLQKIERGVRRPSRAFAERLADVLMIPTQDRPRFLQLARIDQAHAADSPAERNALPIAIQPRSVRPAVALVGRDGERAALVARLREEGQRLITLVGAGGIGKTSLALHASADLAGDARFPDGVAVALLASVVASEDVPLAIAEALGLSMHGTHSVADRLIEVLRDRTLLLVLDNLEHLLGAQAGAMLIQLISRVLAEALNVCILATSRERLRLRDERVIDLGGLAFPASDTSLRVDRLAAVQLFVERAQRVGATFALRADNRAAVARICRRLEGLPLAIELAAAWTRALTAHEIATEIDQSLDFLAGDNRDTPDRHRSVRAALDHSWRLLNDAERQTLMRLSVFQGGGDRDAITHVTGTSLSTLTALIDKSLLRVTTAGGSARYVLHELVRQYAAEHLAADPADEQATAKRHTAYYGNQFQQKVAAQTGASAPEAMAALYDAIDNLRAAWMWAATHGDSATVMAMARGLSMLYDTHGWLLDGVAIFGRVAEALSAATSDTLLARGHIIGWQGYFLYRAGQLTEAARLLEDGVALMQAAGSTAGLANLLLHLGSVAMFSGRYVQAQAYHRQAAQVAEASGDVFTVHWVTFFTGHIALLRGDLATAEQQFGACLTVWRSQGLSRGVVASLMLLGETVRLTGRIAEAEALIQESLRISGATRDRSTIAACLRELGALALARGEFDEARYLLIESYEGMRALGDPMYAGRSRSLLIRLEAQRGEYGAARQGCAELLHSVRQGLTLLLAEAAYGLALILVAERSEQEALAVLLALDGTPGEYATLSLAAEVRADLQRRLSSEQQAAAIERAGTQALLPLLEKLCARPSSLPPLATTAIDTPIVPTGALFVAETGATLSPREVEVLRLMIAGVSNQTIADTLIISLHTAKKHVASVLEKLDVATRTQAALRGRALGLTPHEYRRQ